MQIVEQSMMNNYSGLFPLKNDTNFNPSTEQKLHQDGTILHQGQMNVTEGGW